MQMFQQEARMLSRLVHPNIVYFMGAYVKETDGYIVVEHCSRGSLRSILDDLDRGETDWIWKCKIALCTARGLLYLHQTAQPTIIHRDLKSPNVLVSDYCTAKVADFGTARLKETLASEDTDWLMTTARWTAPEIVKQSFYSNAVDIFAFGLIFV